MLIRRLEQAAEKNTNLKNIEDSFDRHTDKDMKSLIHSHLTVESSTLEVANSRVVSEEDAQVPINLGPVGENSTFWRHVINFTTGVRRLFEPRIQGGQIRVRWKCVSSTQVLST